MTSEINTGPQADFVFLHANVYTGVTQDRKPQRAEAMAIARDKILAVGSPSDMLMRRGPETKVVDLDGNFVMPGFNDAHCT